MRSDPPWRMRGLAGSAVCAVAAPLLLASACLQALGLCVAYAVSAALLLAAPPWPLLAAACAQPLAAGAQGGAGRCAAGMAGSAAAEPHPLSAAMSRPGPAGLAAQACSEMVGAPDALPGAAAAGVCEAPGACCCLIWLAACSALHAVRVPAAQQLKSVIGSRESTLHKKSQKCASALQGNNSCVAATAPRGQEPPGKLYVRSGPAGTHVLARVAAQEGRQVCTQHIAAVV